MILRDGSFVRLRMSGISLYDDNKINIIIPRGQRISEPIDLRSHNAHDITIILEPSSCATIILRSHPGIREATITRRIQCILQEQATLTLHYNEAWHETITSKAEVAVEQKAYSMLYYNHSVQGGGQVYQQFSLMITEPEAHAEIRGIYQVTGKGSVAMTTLQHHDAKYSVSNLQLRGTARDTAQIHHQGTINITKNGAHTESAQHTQLLLLSDQARATSIPNIEVLTHEVQCAHGSAIGRLDQEQLWYLQARGLSPDKAEQMLIDGFLIFKG